MRLLRYPIGPAQANCYILVEEDINEAVVIDPGQGIEPVVGALGKLDVAMILLTHGHFDHMAGAATLKEVTGAPVCIHSAEADWPLNPALNGSLHFADACPEPVNEPAPDVLLQDGDELEWAGPTIVCLHTPGHTPGGTSFYLPSENVVFTGDALFAGGIGRSDLPGGDGRLLLRSIREKLLTLDPETTVYPGHGEHTSIQEEADYNPFLFGWDDE